MVHLVRASSLTTLFILYCCTPGATSPTVQHRTVTSTAKAGLPWPNGPSIDINQYRTTGKVQWYYTWSPSSFDTDLEFVPMFWGETSINEWQSTINSTIRNRHVTSALGFNEPQQQGQANLSPTDGASLWKTYIEPLKSQGIRLGSPAPSSAPSGKQWLLDWLTQCDGGCTVDFIALHWYDINSTAFINYLEDFHNTFQRPLWVTEWACQNFNDANEQCSQQDIVDFMNATESFMDSTDWVERYAWFGAMIDMSGVNQDDSLMDSTGKINTLGEQYIGALAPNTSANYTPGDVHGGSGSGPVVAGSSPSFECTTAGLLTTMVAVAAAVLL